MLKDILVHVDGTEAGERRLELALALACHCHARLTGLHVTPPAAVGPVYKPSQVAGAKMIAGKDALLEAEVVEVVFGRIAGNAAIDAEWRARSGHLTAVIAEEARTCDLLILGQYEWESPAIDHPLSLAEAVVGHCGRPILVLPEATCKVPLSQALIAWDGSREAVRAVHDAIPLLTAYQTEVSIAWFADEQEAVDLRRLQSHLERHGLVVSGLHALPARASSASERLLERVKRGHFDLLVMGAFGHPAWFEFLFGGTTQTALLKVTIPLLISH